MRHVFEIILRLTVSPPPAAALIGGGARTPARNFPMLTNTAPGYKTFDLATAGRLIERKIRAGRTGHGRANSRTAAGCFAQFWRIPGHGVALVSRAQRHLDANGPVSASDPFRHSPSASVLFWPAMNSASLH
jgi:hypothetical protein